MKLSIATKIFIAFAAVIVIFMAVLTFGIHRTQTTYDQIQSVNQSAVPLSLLLSDVQTDLKSFSLVLNEKDPLVLRRTLQVTRLGPSVPERLRVSMERAAEVARTANFETTQPDNDIGKSVAALQRDIDVFAGKAQTLTKVVLADDPESNAKVESMQAELRDESRGLDTRLSQLRNDLRIATNQGLDRARELERSSIYLLSAASATALVIAIILLVAVLLTMRRLTTLTEAAKRIGGGDYSPLQNLPSAKDEIGALTLEFDHMARSIAERDQALRDQHAKLLKTERLATIGQMTSLITHELRNPLSSINLNTEMLAEALSESSASKEDPDILPVLDTIVSEVDRLKDITEEYLVYARLPTPKFEPHNLADTLHGIVDFHSFEWSNDSVDVVVDVPDDIIADVDPGQFRQAFLNLMKNAVEASPPESEVHVHAQATNGVVTIEVLDRAGGIPDTVRDHIFEPFYTTKSSGTGLGLAMTQQIIEEHNGQISVEPTKDGTRFVVTLPRFQ